MAIASSETHDSIPGAIIAVVGPSGAGKDSVIAGARALLVDDPRIVFPRRVITRRADRTEENLVVDVDTFLHMAKSGAFALFWSAHGHHYGVPVRVDADVRERRIVVINVSRTIVTHLRNRYVRASVILINAPAHVRSKRLALRSRETESEILSRLERTAENFDAATTDMVIDNAGPLEHSVTMLSTYVRSLLPKPHYLT